MDDRIAKPPPPGIAIVADAWTAPFWEAATRHELVLARCTDCRHFRMPPTPFCPHCHSQAICWEMAPAAARLYSYTIVERSIFPGMEDTVPYVPAIVEFPDAQGVRLISNVVGARLDAIAVGVPLSLAWLDLPDGQPIPIFHIARPNGNFPEQPA